MRRIIDGLRYDTEKAKKIGSVPYFFELYKTPNGRFFAFYISGGEIRPLTVSEAKRFYEWLSYTSIGYEEAFGEPPEEA